MYFLNLVFSIAVPHMIKVPVHFIVQLGCLDSFTYLYNDTLLHTLYISLNIPYSSNTVHAWNTVRTARKPGLAWASMLLDGLVSSRRVPLNPLANHKYPYISLWCTYHSHTSLIFRSWTQLFIVLFLAKWAQSFRVKRRCTESEFGSLLWHSRFWRLLLLRFAICRCPEILRSLPPRFVPGISLNSLEASWW